MIGPLLAILLLSGAPQAATDSAPAAPAQGAATQTAIEPGMMSCSYQGRRNRTCTTSDGEVLRCQRQRELGSHFSSWVCFTYREDQTIQRDSQNALDRQQHITTPGGG